MLWRKILSFITVIFLAVCSGGLGESTHALFHLLANQDCYSQGSFEATPSNVYLNLSLEICSLKTFLASGSGPIFNGVRAVSVDRYQSLAAVISAVVDHRYSEFTFSNWHSSRGPPAFKFI